MRKSGSQWRGWPGCGWWWRDGQTTRMVVACEVSMAKYLGLIENNRDEMGMAERRRGVDGVNRRPTEAATGVMSIPARRSLSLPRRTGLRIIAVLRKPAGMAVVGRVEGSGGRG